MKIAYIITKSNYGGAQKYVFELATSAKKRGHDVLVAVGGTGEANAAPGKLVEKLLSADISVHLVQSFMRDVSLLRDGKALLELYRLCKTEKPDIVHLSSSKAGGLGAVAAKLAGVPKILFTIHGLPTNEMWRPRWQRWLIHFLTIKTVALTDATITITTKDYTTLNASVKKPSTIHLIPNGIAAFPHLTKTEARTALLPYVAKDVVCIGGIGELHPNKNWSLLLHVAQKLPKHVHVCIIGEGEEMQTLQTLADQLQIAERVHLLGYKTDAQQYMALFDIFVLPSKKEGLPYVLLEAGLCHVPVVATNLPTIEDIISTGETGLLVEPTKTNISAAIEILLRDVGMRNRLGTALYEYVLNNFSLEKMEQETFSLYESIIAKSGDGAAA